MKPDEIREARVTLGLTQVEMARVMGVDVMTISRWEVGGRNPQRLAVRLIEAYLRGDRPDDWPVKKSHKPG